MYCTNRDEELTGEDDGFVQADDIKKAAETTFRSYHGEGDSQEGENEWSSIRDNSHIDLSLIVSRLHCLHKISIIYEMQEMDMDWEERYFCFTDRDVEYLAKGTCL